MRAMTGTVTASKLISVSKAVAILGRFAAADIGARREVAAYLNRASNAFEDLVQVHRELRHSHKRAEVEIKQEVVEDREEEGKAAEEKRKKKKKKDREDGSSRVGDNGNLTEVDRDQGEGNVEERKKSKQKSPDEEKRDLEKNNEVLKAKVKVEVDEVEEARSEDWRKEKKRKHLNVEEVEGGADNGSERREKNKERRKTRTKE